MKRQKTLKIKDWTDTLKYVVDQYNDKEHTTTGVTPNYASTAKYQDVVRENIEKKATFDRKYDSKRRRPSKNLQKARQIIRVGI